MNNMESPFHARSLSVVGEVLERPASSFTTDELASEINRVHAEVGEALSASLEYAIRAGDLLIEAKSRVKHGGWCEWLKENCSLSENWAQVYMRISRHRELVREHQPPGVKAAEKFLSERCAPDTRIDPTAIAEAQRLKNEGLLNREIAEQLGVSTSTITLWLNPRAAERYRAKKRNRTRRDRADAKRYQRMRDARRVGGDLGKTYSLVREALDVFQQISDAREFPQREIAAAMHDLYKVEDRIGTLLRQAPSASKEAA